MMAAFCSPMAFIFRLRAEGSQPSLNMIEMLLLEVTPLCGQVVHRILKTFPISGSRESASFSDWLRSNSPFKSCEAAFNRGQVNDRLLHLFLIIQIKLIKPRSVGALTVTTGLSQPLNVLDKPLFDLL